MFIRIFVLAMGTFIAAAPVVAAQSTSFSYAPGAHQRGEAARFRSAHLGEIGMPDLEEFEMFLPIVTPANKKRQERAGLTR